MDLSTAHSHTERARAAETRIVGGKRRVGVGPVLHKPHSSNQVSAAQHFAKRRVSQLLIVGSQGFAMSGANKIALISRRLGLNVVAGSSTVVFFNNKSLIFIWPFIVCAVAR